jgi:prevent-host-death family protein
MSEFEGVPVADFKRDFHRYAGEVERGGRVLVTRHGRPVGEFVPAGARLSASSLPSARRPGGLLAVLGLFDSWKTMEKDMAAVVATRQSAKDRRPPTLD